MLSPTIVTDSMVHEDKIEYDKVCREELYYNYNTGYWVLI